MNSYGDNTSISFIESHGTLALHLVRLPGCRNSRGCTTTLQRWRAPPSNNTQTRCCTSASLTMGRCLVPVQRMALSKYGRRSWQHMFMGSVLHRLSYINHLRMLISSFYLRCAQILKDNEFNWSLMRSIYLLVNFGWKWYWVQWKMFHSRWTE